MSSREMFPNYSVEPYLTAENWPLEPYSDIRGTNAIGRQRGAEESRLEGWKSASASEYRFTVSVPAQPEGSWDELPKIRRLVEDLPSVRDLFSELPATSPLSSALSLLDEAVSRCERALELLQENNPVAADDEMQQVNSLLPELFCCRSIGDGFGAFVNTIRYAFVNKKGDPMSEPQIAAIFGGLSRLKNAPYTEFENSVDFAIELEQCGLIVDPPALTDLADEPGD